MKLSGVRVIAAPVDAEYGRGTGQVQMVTRSGSNQFRGSVFWTNRNSALDASNWFNNFRGVRKDYENRNQFGGRFGGPIIKNKTFFFVLRLKWQDSDSGICIVRIWSLESLGKREGLITE